MRSEFQQNRMVILFFKYHEPATHQVHDGGHHCALIKWLLADLVPVLLHRADLLPHAQLELYKEVTMLHKCLFLACY